MRDFSDLAVSATGDCFSYAAAAAKRTKGKKQLFAARWLDVRLTRYRRIVTAAA